MRRLSPDQSLRAEERPPPPVACALERLTKVGFLVCSFEMHPFGRRLDEEVADEVAVVLTWTRTEERVHVDGSSRAQCSRNTD